SDFVARLNTVREGPAHPPVADRVAAARVDVRAMIANDLNVPGALGVIFDLVREMHAAMDRGDLGEPDAMLVQEAFYDVDKILGVMQLRKTEDAQPPVPVDEIEKLIAERRESRKARNFARADEIRRDLEARGIVLEDTSAG